MQCGDSFTVTITADDNLLEYLEVELQGSTLVLGLRNISVEGATLKAAITMPALERLRLSGASDVTLSGFRSTGALALHLSGASCVRGAVESATALITCSGASKVALTGLARDLTVHASGKSGVNLEGFSVANARVGLSGASQAQVTVRQHLDYDLSGSSHLGYAGSPDIGLRSVSGSSRVTRH